MANDCRKFCRKHPSMRGFCACDRSARGTNLTPIFSLHEGKYLGYPLIEVLKNGGPIHRFDSHFSFGVRKAEMIIACLEPIKEFAWASDEERRSFESRTIQEGPRAIRVFVEFRENFEWSTGELVEQPWLRLESVTGYWPRIKGLGVMKCRAVWTLREEIGEWVGRHTGHPGPSSHRNFYQLE